jgi:hypothetical protein
MIIAVDFDGTCVKHSFPEMGEENFGAVEVLRELVEAGHQLILYTMRSNSEKYPTSLTEAIAWFAENDILLYGIQTNPTQRFWTTSNKCYAELYIDDAALGCPLTQDGPNGHPRSYVDWFAVRELLVKMELLT